jgi:phosphotransferase system  glucose/maltose/N-acetylglucosamine-specific IIC component
MTASWRGSLFLGFISFLFTFLFSIVNNTWQMSLFRAFIGFLVFFLLGTILQFLLYLFAPIKNTYIQSEEDKKELTEQKETQDEIDSAQSEDPLFQEVTLGSLHNGDSSITNQ